MSASRISPHAPKNENIKRICAGRAPSSRATVLNRDYDGVFKAEPLPEQSTPEHRVRNAIFPRPLRDSLVFTESEDANVSAAISGLLCWCRPAAVIFFIPSVIVSSIYGMMRRWALADVRDEGHEVVPPSLANRDPARTVAMEGFVVRVVTSRNHGLPDGIHWMSRPAMFGRNLAHHLAPHVGVEASARSGVAAAKIARCRNDGSTAVTKAHPAGRYFVNFLRMLGLNDQATEPNSSEIKKFSHQQMQYHFLYCNAMV